MEVHKDELCICDSSSLKAVADFKRDGLEAERIKSKLSVDWRGQGDQHWSSGISQLSLETPKNDSLGKMMS